MLCKFGVDLEMRLLNSFKGRGQDLYTARRELHYFPENNGIIVKLQIYMACLYDFLRKSGEKTRNTSRTISYARFVVGVYPPVVLVYIL